MSIERHMENRAWAFHALDTLEQFLEDPDFQGSVDEEQGTIGRKRRELRDGKYRVVFLGAFNVGKSTMINAFLGEEYLPTILEECTTKITHVVRDEAMRVTLHLSEPASEEEMAALRSLLENYSSDLSLEASEDAKSLVIGFATEEPALFDRCLRALTTFSADEDFPHLRPLRDKYEEVEARIPNEQLEEDIALVDSPGVYSISETNQRVAQGIIPDSHLVVCMLDSHNAGNEQSRDFIEKIVKERHRKVFFVINKCDQLNEEEIDPSGRRGPAKDLLRSLDGVVDGPELFFVSSLYALAAQQLASGRLTLDEIEANPKLHIPYGVYKSLRESANPAQAVSEWLLERSRFGSFRKRLQDYLYVENREGAVVESVCRFLDGRAWKFARPLEVRLELARQVPRLDELAAERARLNADLREREAHAARTLETYDKLANGGAGTDQNPGYEGLLEQRLGQREIENGIIKPMQRWIEDRDNLRAAKANNYEPFLQELERRVEAFLSETEVALNQHAEVVENEALAQAGEVGAHLHQRTGPRIKGECPKPEPVAVPMAGSYFLWTIVGAALFGAIGAAAAWAIYPELNIENMVILGTDILIDHDIAVLMGLGDGAIAGGMLGLLLRAMSANARRRKLLEASLEIRVRVMVLGGNGNPGLSVRASLASALAQRRDHFRNELKRAFDNFSGEVRGKLANVQAEEDELKAEQRATVERVEPKLLHLQELGRSAHEIAKQGARPLPAAAEG